MYAFLYKLGLAIKLALVNFIKDEGFVYASHISFTCILALFPFLIFVTSIAALFSGFMGLDNLSHYIVGLIFDSWPEDIAEPIAKEIYNVLSAPHAKILTLSILATLYFASNGVDALRVSLNRAYGLVETRGWFLLRLHNIIFIILASIFLVAASLIFIAIPVLSAYMPDNINIFLINFKNANSLLALISLVSGVFACHIYLPNIKFKLSSILPGVILSFMLWGIGSYFFVLYLKNLANYFSTYAGLASIVIVMIFLYIIGLIFILGAEFNAALAKVFKRHCK